MEGSERLPFEADAVGGRREQQRRGQGLDPDVGEARVLEGIPRDRQITEAERPGLTGQRRRKSCAPADQGDRLGEERVAFGGGVDDRRESSTVAQAGPDPPQGLGAVREVDQTQPGDRRVELLGPLAADLLTVHLAGDDVTQSVLVGGALGIGQVRR